MEGIKQWAFSVCLAMVACGLAQMLLPKAGMEKIFRMTVSIFFLCCLLSPVVLRNPGLALELTEYSQSDINERARRLLETVEAQAEETTRWELEKIIAEKLRQMGINYRDITINIITNGQSGQEIESVEITLDDAHVKEHKTILDTLNRDLGIKVRLGYVAGGEE